MIAPRWFQNWVIEKAKSYHPRISEAFARDYSSYGVPSEQQLDKNIEAIQFSIWAYTCINRIAQDIAGLPMKFWRGYDEEKKEEAMTDPIADLIFRPNHQDTHRDLWEASIWFLLTTGAAYWALDKLSRGGKIIRGKGKVWEGMTELWMLPSHQVKPVVERQKGIIKYIVTQETGAEIAYAADEVVRFKNFNPKSDYYGLAPITIAARSLGADFYAREWNRRFFQNDASPGMQLSSDQPYDPDVEKRLLEGWESKHQGISRWHSLAIFWKGLKPIGNEKRNPKDLDFLNLIKLNREEITSLFGVPPAVVGLFEYANYANALMQKKEFWSGTLIPLMHHFETTFNEIVIPRWTDEELWMEFDISQVDALQEDRLQKAQIQRIHWTSNMKTINELRAEEDLPPVDGGDVLYKDTIPGPFGLDSIIPESGKLFEQKAIDKRLERWAAKDLNRRKMELGFMRAMNLFFEEQKDRVLALLASGGGNGSVALISVDAIFNEDQEAASLRDIGEPLIKTAVANAGQAAIEEVSKNKTAKVVVAIGNGKTSLRNRLLPSAVKQDEDEIEELIGVFDISDPRVARWIERNVADFVSDVIETTKEKIRRIILEGQDQGWSMQQMANELTDMFEEFSRGRSITIARTEMGTATNSGTYAGYVQAGVEKKEWLATPDERVRPDHLAAMNAGPIPLGEKFQVGNDLLDYPMDPSGSPEQTINCRCALASDG